MTPSPPPKGSLEDLFRHHLLESEAAAVPPRPQVWEQLDNRLLLAQNARYRQRLVAYRWAVAASLLLASLAGGGWWHSQRAAATDTLAQATPQATSRPGLATARRAAPAPVANPLAAGPAAGLLARAAGSLSTPNSSAIDPTATLSASAQSGALSVVRTARPELVTTSRGTRLARPGRADARSRALAFNPKPTYNELVDKLTEYPAAAAATADDRAGATLAATGRPGRSEALAAEELAGRGGATADQAGAPYALAPARTPAAEDNLAIRWASLSQQAAAGLPASLAPVAVAAGPPLELARRWQYGLSYAASAYRPNIDFAKAPEAYNTVLGLNSPIITRSAAAEYRDHLRPGLGQRLSLWATRRLGASRWSLRTGLEVAQNTATSASSVAFVGEQVADLTYTQAAFYPAPQPARLQRTSYRYRSVNVPVEARYTNPTKTGFSFYGRVGALVTALLSAHSEVEGNPEAERTYSLGSANSPYRHLSMGLRGGGGVQYRPAGHQWALSLGPVAEMGILSLNANPSQSFLTQQRPYSFGLEAGMELGRGFKIQ